MEFSSKNPGKKESITATAQRLKVFNPYYAYGIESGRWFYHEDVVKKIKFAFEKKPLRKLIVIQGNKGSGKSSTLLRMQEDDNILGERYKTIYIDSDAFKSNDVDLYLSYIYKASIKSLKHYNLELDETNFLMEQGISLKELISFVNNVEDSLRKDEILIYIFDEFDKLQRTVENQLLIKSIVDFFRYLINNKKKFRLILSGERQIFELARKTKTEDFFQSSILINIENIFEAQDVRRGIIEPVKEHVNYTPEAIEFILEITGRNLYCQQLLCFYIFNYLKKTNRTTCNVNDVRQASEILINDTREDFNYYWDTIDWKYQLITSALADETITKKKGQKYFIEGTNLLYAIFGEEEFHQFLENLYKDQRVSIFEGVRFDDYPITVPIYGEWVKKKRSFINTIIQNWNQVADYISFKSLPTIMELLPANKIPLEKEVIENTIKISKVWIEIQNSIHEKKQNRALIDTFINLFCDILGFEVVFKPDSRKNYYTINMGNLNFAGIKDVLYFFLVKDDLDDLDMIFIQNEILRQDKPGTPSFIFCFNKSKKLMELVRKKFLSIVLIEDNDLKNVILSPFPHVIFKNEIILKRVTPSTVSTYTTEGPVKITFFGRVDEISKIIRARRKNFAILGARKIGKTSLLQKIRDELPSNLIPIYLDLEAPQDQNYNTFLRLLSDELSHAYYWIDELTNDFANMRRVIRRLRQQSAKTPIFILDEIDALLKFDRENDYQLLSTLRAIFNEGHIQIIISGYEELYYEKHKIESPLFNLCHPLQLDKLKREEALDLITIPMENIGVRYNKLEDRELMLNYTSQHPNLLQYFCVHLIEKIESHEQEKYQRVIFKEDIEEIFGSPEYERYIVDDFYLFFTEDISPIEQLIILLLIYHYPSQNSYMTTEISSILKEYDINFQTVRLTKHLDKLSLRYILEKETGGKYSFALPIFPEILRRRYDLKNLIKEALEDARKSLQIYGSPTSNP